MQNIGRWLVPVFLVLAGIFLLWLANLVWADAIENTAYVNAHDCASGAPCATLSCTPECSYAVLTGATGATVLATGVVVGLVRWLRAHRVRLPTRP